MTRVQAYAFYKSLGQMGYGLLRHFERRPPHGRVDVHLEFLRGREVHAVPRAFRSLATRAFYAGRRDGHHART